MQTPPVAPVRAHLPRKVLVTLSIGWALIVAKCVATPMLIDRWNVPIAPGWVIWPTLMFAVLISVLVLTHDWAHDE